MLILLCFYTLEKSKQISASAAGEKIEWIFISLIMPNILAHPEKRF
jgi:hypothetical protein